MQRYGRHGSACGPNLTGPTAWQNNKSHSKHYPKDCDSKHSQHNIPNVQTTPPNSQAEKAKINVPDCQGKGNQQMPAQEESAVATIKRKP